MTTLAFLGSPTNQRHLGSQSVHLRKKSVVQRAFKQGWFDKWKCVHYDETADPHICAKAREVEGELKGFHVYQLEK